MEPTILIGKQHQIHAIPQSTWQEHLSDIPQHAQTRLSFMTEVHHRVRYLVVKELVNQQKPIQPEFIAKTLNLPLAQVTGILEELEQKLFFLVRDGQGAVAWAYPVTVEPTPHKLTFSSGEKLYAAWAEDALATPFVQGRLRNEFVAVEVETKCKHCEQVLHITVNSQMQVSVREQGAAPLVFSPEVDWSHFAQKTIIDAFWRNSVFFWSEEHAREYRANTQQVDGIYLTLEQCAYLTPFSQGGLFAFNRE